MGDNSQDTAAPERALPTSKRCHGVDRLIPVLPAAPASIDNRTYVVTGAAGAHDEVAIGAVRQCDLRGRTDAKCNKCGADNTNERSRCCHPINLGSLFRKMAHRILFLIINRGTGIVHCH